MNGIFKACVELILVIITENLDFERFDWGKNSGWDLFDSTMSLMETILCIRI